jgi:hypothetical protein
MSQYKKRKICAIVSDVPRSISNYMMKYLNLKDVITSSMVCKIWNGIAYEEGGVGNHHIEMSKKTLLLCKNLSLAQRTCIRNITIRNLNDEEFLELSLQLTGLTHVAILSNTCPNASKYLRNLNNLTCLELHKIFSLQNIFCLTQLKELFLQGFYSSIFTPQDLSQINHDSLPFLESLVLSGIKVKDKSEGKDDPFAMWQSWSTLNLKYFKIDNCQGLNSGNVFPQSSDVVGWDNVQTLSIHENEWLDDEIMKNIPYIFPNLTSLDLTGMIYQPKYTHVGLGYLNVLKDLTFLRLGRMNNFALSNLSLVNISKISSLKTLDLMYWDEFIFTAENILPLKNLPMLKNLGMFGHKPISKEIIPILQKIPELQLFICNNYDDFELLQLEVGGLYHRLEIFHIVSPFQY